MGDGSVQVGTMSIKVPNRTGGPVEIMMRPHRIRITDAAEGEGGLVNRIDGIIRRVTFVGDLLQYHVDVEGSEIIVEAASDHGRGIRNVGMPVTLSWRIEDTMVFARNA